MGEVKKTSMSFPNSHGILFSRRKKKNAQERRGSRRESIRLNLKQNISHYINNESITATIYWGLRRGSTLN